MPAPTLAAFERPITVGIADLSVTNNPSVILTTYSLGSCLGVTLHDPVACVGGMLHLMLPDSSINKEKARSKPAMFADSGVPMLIDHALKLGASLDRMRVCVAGGSQIMDAQGFFNIGKRNYIALVMLLSNRGLEIDVEDIGGSGNRTMSMRLSDGQVKLKISGKPDPVIL